MAKNKKKKKNPAFGVTFSPNSPDREVVTEPTNAIGRYLLVGAGLGGYMGYFFAPSEEIGTELSFGGPIMLGILVIVGYVIFMLFRKPRPAIKDFIVEALFTGTLAMAFLIALEFRRIIYVSNGRWMTFLYGLAIGLALGVGMYFREQIRAR